MSDARTEPPAAPQLDSEGLAAPAKAPWVRNPKVTLAIIGGFALAGAILGGLRLPAAVVSAGLLTVFIGWFVARAIDIRGARKHQELEPLLWTLGPWLGLLFAVFGLMVLAGIAFPLKQEKAPVVAAPAPATTPVQASSPAPATSPSASPDVSVPSKTWVGYTADGEKVTVVSGGSTEFTGKVPTAISIIDNLTAELDCGGLIDELTFWYQSSVNPERSSAYRARAGAYAFHAYKALEAVGC